MPSSQTASPASQPSSQRMKLLGFFNENFQSGNPPKGGLVTGFRFFFRGPPPTPLTKRSLVREALLPSFSQHAQSGGRGACWRGLMMMWFGVMTAGRARTPGRYNLSDVKELCCVKSSSLSVCVRPPKATFPPLSSLARPNPPHPRRVYIPSTLFLMPEPGAGAGGCCA